MLAGFTSRRADWTVQTKNEFGDDDVEMVFGPYPETED